MAMPILHKRIAVSTSFHAHIPHVIRASEPHLSIAQKTQLKKEGKHKGQQPRYSGLLDPDAIPPCTDYMRQLVIGVLDPGKKHKPILLKYLEDLLKNLHYLEYADIKELTDLVSQKNLKGLSLHPQFWKDKEMLPLANIKNLEHLCVGRPFLSHTVGILQPILLNSMQIIQGLELHTSKSSSSFLEYWGKQVEPRHPDAVRQVHDFTAFKSLTLVGFQYSAKDYECIMPTITRAFDFLRLREPRLINMREDKLVLFQHLETLFGSANHTTIHLRSLCLELSDDKYRQNYCENELQLECIYRFICSFDTLTSLEITNYNAYTDDLDASPVLSLRPQQSILMQKDLRSLMMTFRGLESIPYISTETVALLINELPQLQEFQFSLESHDIVNSRALAQGKNLTTIRCDYHQGQFDYSQTRNPSPPVFETIIRGFLSSPSDTSDFVWESYYKLRNMTVGVRSIYDIASSFGDTTNTMKISEGGCHVTCRDLEEIVHPRRY
ncbi:hypothetical protein FZEAL_5327 [Fusarium zealandicum]|uniref:Uncharacterized protein n=1 Tax=Fusarium zealandicum TaxID=1053134 RepID=A0A8H4UJY2_9HYPO|nr:hypothetical protein FZEAL_5327 [Fusarium zealandicum]